MSNGFTKMDNDFLEALYSGKANLSGSEIRILLYILRYTVGYQRESVSVSVKEIARATGLTSRQVRRAVIKLQELGALLRFMGAEGKANTYKIGKNEFVSACGCDTSDTSTTAWDSEKTDSNVIPHEGNADLDVIGGMTFESENADLDVIPPMTYASPPTLYKENNKEKERYVCKDKGTHAPDFFSRLWSEYPQQIGKGKLTNEDYEALSRYSYDELHRAIERYKRDKEEKDIDFWQNGSTFFKTGYVDFLDENYKGEPLPEEKKKKRRYEG